jgi:dihydroorotase
VDQLNNTRPELAVVNARLVTPDAVWPGGLAATEGRITHILEPGQEIDADRVVDADGRYLLPGLIDSHVHFRTPGLTHKEDWAHASRAAAAGGMTTVIDMPNTQPPLFDPAEAQAKADQILGESLVDFRFHLGVDGDRSELLQRTTPRVATSAKVFMAGHHTAPHVVRDPQQLDRTFAIAAEIGLQLVLHAEDDHVFGLLDSWRGEPQQYREYEPSRPRSGGIIAVAKVIDLVQRHGTRAHVLHMSSSEEADLLSAAAASGLPVTFEVTAHHLSFTAGDSGRVGARTRLSPAIRQQSDQDRLWQAVLAGQAATIGSDHAPHSIEEKLRPVPDAPPGLPGVQELLPAVFTGLVDRLDGDTDTAVRRIAQLCSAGPAVLFGLASRKGALAPGFDADFVLLDESRYAVHPRDLYAKCGWSAYEGRTMLARPHLTVRRGEVIWDAEQSTFGTPAGRWLSADEPAADEPAPPTVAAG